MSYEIIMLAKGDVYPISIEYSTDLMLLNENEHPNDAGRFLQTWPFMSSTNGLLYSICVMNDGWLNTMPIIDIDFDYNVQGSILPYWIDDEDVYSNIKPIIISPIYENDIEITIGRLVEESTEKTLLFLCRFQGGDTEIIYGVIKVEKFLRMLHNKKIYSNICYIIQR